MPLAIIIREKKDASVLISVAPGCNGRSSVAKNGEPSNRGHVLEQ